jgi:hypothetical protein
MEQKAPDEFLGGQDHCFNLIASAIVFPLELNVIVFDVEQPVIGDGNAVGITAHVIEHLLGSGERSFGVDDPVALFQGRQIPGECGPVLQRLQRAEELEFACMERFRERFQEESPE